MPSRKGRHHHPPVCDATGLVIVCMRCLRPPKGHRKHSKVCDYHDAVQEFRREGAIDDTRPFDLTTFIQKIEWNKVLTSCEPELPMLFKSIKRANEEIARRVV